MELLLVAGSGWQNNKDASSSSSSRSLSASLPKWSSASSEARFTQQHIVHPQINREAGSKDNVSVLVGKQVILRCVINDLGNESVSKSINQSRNAQVKLQWWNG